MKRKMQLMGMIMGWFAIIAQFVFMLEHREVGLVETIIRFFSFFTILTNLLVALYFTFHFFGLTHILFSIFVKNSTFIALTVFILLVGIVYQIALRHVWEPTGLQMVVDELLHTAIPLYFLIYWYLFYGPPKVSFRSVLFWLVYPVGYFTFIIIKGHFSGFYPYPFVNLPKIGFVKLAFNFGTILGVITFLMAILVAVGNKKIGSDL